MFDRILGKEPLVFFGLVAGAIVAIANVILPTPLGQETVNNINSVALFVGPLVLALIGRIFVKPVPKDERGL